ncbi:hypothetical protein E4L95_12345 [Paracoccus liaowanqingii]|uniref:Uncharacterized protein n=1 Tax=Paracoccus liaowanqingii TaxID=2560053 RepID=A0A4Z1C8M3_9RHOB|nr:hypothetical protein [Paracoccus liaowanqingii]TGN58594.1 hypothetical protein E4L95_12345 [Paracoccus liaowanqingii]
MHDPRDMTKHEWDMAWCRGQGSKHADEVAAYKQATPEDAMKGAHQLIRKSMAITLDDPIYAAIDYVVIARSALDADLQEAEREALQRLLAHVEQILRFADKNASEASKMLWAKSK